MLYPLIENMTNEEPVTKLAKRKLTIRDKKRHTSTNYEDEADRLIFPGVHNEQPGFYSSFREMHIMGYFERGEKDKEEKMLEILAKKKSNLKKKNEKDEINDEENEENEEAQDLLLSLEKKDILTNAEEAEVNYVEKRLCTIRAYENGWISLTPAYNQKYRFTIGDYDVYEFSLENCSSQLTSAEEQKEWDLFETVDKKRMEIRNYIVGKSFQEIPEMLGFRLMIFGEIVSARKFEESSIYIQYSLELPKYWKKNDINSPKQMLFGNTQSTDFIYDPPTDDYEARFAYPFEFDLLNAHYDPFIKWPVIYFHVCTKDKWFRNITLGYGYYSIPWLPGHYDETINTWRAYPSINERMGQYFVGRTLTLEDISYVNFPRGFNKKYLNKYGFQTETSGSLRIRLNIVHQVGSFHLINPNKDDNGFLKNNNLKEISDALLRARKRVDFLRQQQNKKNN
jgi:Meckel syndrome type 1 protein